MVVIATKTDERSSFPPSYLGLLPRIGVARLLLQRLEAGAQPPDGDRPEFSEIRVGTRLIERDSCRSV
ncbi:MAG TPA: hypothetical protein VFV73_17705 [Streptosporangiaceae bacterium]|nr:hypothetical protein [Streptosporangiaceae bacterium]